MQDALVDLTGGAGEEIDMASPASKIDLASGKLWRQLLRFKAENFLLGAGSPSGSEGIPETVSEAGLVQGISDAGIVQSHAYSILNVRTFYGCEQMFLIDRASYRMLLCACK